MTNRKTGWLRTAKQRGKDAQQAYKKHGYSKVSLNMLESEEGQLNAVFACYGSAAQHGQFFEESLTKLIVVLNGWSGMEGEAEKMEKWTIGKLLNHFEQRFVEKIDEWVPEHLNEGRRLRNFLIHEFFLKRMEELRTESGRMALLKELIEIERHLKRGEDLINGLRVAVGEAMNAGSRPEGKRSQVVYSVDLHIDNPES